jgi:hypothetical protein
LGREGWTKRQFQPGDQITITVFPSKAGAPVGVVDRTHPIMANGKEAVKANARNVDWTETVSAALKEHIVFNVQTIHRVLPVGCMWDSSL